MTLARLSLIAAATTLAAATPVAATATAAKAACTVTVGKRAVAADLERGRRGFLKCRACHTLKAGERNLVGPNLGKMLERGPLAAAGFNYSPAFQAAKPRWTATSLDAFLRAPAKTVPGNRMVFAGLTKAEERADIIAWVAKESGTPLRTCR